MAQRINGFEQIKGFYSWVFNNPDKIRPTHISLYLFLLNQNNRSNWVEWFKCPYDLAMQGACIGNNGTYYKGLDDLKAWNLIDYQKGINNFKAPLVKLFVLYENEQVTVPLSEQLSEQLSVQQTAQQPVQLSAQLPVHIYKLITDNIETINNRQDEFLCLIKNFINPKSKVIDLSFYQKDFIPIVEKWLLKKKKKKQEYKGQTSINTFCKKLIEYSNGDAIIAEAIIEQSIANNWAGIFELKINGITKTTEPTKSTLPYEGFNPLSIDLSKLKPLR